MSACRDYTEKTGRRISFEYAVIHGIFKGNTPEYAVIHGINDTKADSDGLIGLLHGMNCHVNLIPVNEIKERSYKADRNALHAFAAALEKGGLNATIRRTLGADINAACGQLRREYEI